jgi:hypothetical protein
METPAAVFAYFGSETVLPVTSVVVAVLGVALLFGRPVVRFLAQRFRTDGPGQDRDVAPGRPHFALQRQRRSRSRASGSERADA